MTTKHTSNQLEQLLQLATRGDLVSFLLDYAEENSSFRCDLQSYLGSKYMDNEDTIDIPVVCYCKTKQFLFALYNSLMYYSSKGKS